MGIKLVRFQQGELVQWGVLEDELYIINGSYRTLRDILTTGMGDVITAKKLVRLLINPTLPFFRLLQMMQIFTAKVLTTVHTVLKPVFHSKSRPITCYLPRHQAR